MPTNRTDCCLDEIKLTSRSLFSTPLDEIELKIWRRIGVGDRYDVYYIRDFLDLAPKWTIRKLLKRLEDKNYIKKFRAWPVYWTKAII